MHKMMVLAKAVAGKADELARWYDEVHLKELVAVPGIVSVERHSLFTIKSPEGVPQWDFMMIYEMAGDDPMAVLRNMAAAQVGSSAFLESASTLSVVGTSHGLIAEA